MVTRADLHKLLDELPDSYLAGIAEHLAALRQRRADFDYLNSLPEDDEPLTDDDIAAIEEGHEDVVRGDLMTWDEYLASLPADTR